MDAIEILTDEWVELLGNTVAGRRVDPEVTIVIEHNVTEPDGSVFIWHLAMTEGRAEVALGPGRAGPDRLVFTSDHETANWIAFGEASAQRLFLEGRIRLDGDANLLLTARSAFETLGEAMATVRSRTTPLTASS